MILSVIHLAVFPMYKQNASRDTCFEALIVRVPWPEWLADLERTRYDNAKFVPVTFVDRTAGYDSECAVLFPETVSVATRPPRHHFGAIFCDREAARFRSGEAGAGATRASEPGGAGSGAGAPPAPPPVRPFVRTSSHFAKSSIIEAIFTTS